MDTQAKTNAALDIEKLVARRVDESQLFEQCAQWFWPPKAEDPQDHEAYVDLKLRKIEIFAKHGGFVLDSNDQMSAITPMAVWSFPAQMPGSLVFRTARKLIALGLASGNAQMDALFDQFAGIPLWPAAVQAPHDAKAFLADVSSGKLMTPIPDISPIAALNAGLDDIATMLDRSGADWDKGLTPYAVHSRFGGAWPGDAVAGTLSISMRSSDSRDPSNLQTQENFWRLLDKLPAKALTSSLTPHQEASNAYTIAACEWPASSSADLPNSKKSLWDFFQQLADRGINPNLGSRLFKEAMNKAPIHDGGFLESCHKLRSWGYDFKAHAEEFFEVVSHAGFHPAPTSERLRAMESLGLSIADAPKSAKDFFEWACQQPDPSIHEKAIETFAAMGARAPTVRALAETALVAGHAQAFDLVLSSNGAFPRTSQMTATSGHIQKLFDKACALQDAQAILLAAKHGADPKTRDHFKRNALHLALREKGGEAQLGAIQALLSLGVDPGERELKGATPAQIPAARRGRAGLRRGSRASGPCPARSGWLGAGRLGELEARRLGDDERRQKNSQSQALTPAHATGRPLGRRDVAPSP